MLAKRPRRKRERKIKFIYLSSKLTHGAVQFWKSHEGKRFFFLIEFSVVNLYVSLVCYLVLKLIPRYELVTICNNVSNSTNWNRLYSSVADLKLQEGKKNPINLGVFARSISSLMRGMFMKYLAMWNQRLHESVADLVSYVGGFIKTLRLLRMITNQLMNVSKLTQGNLEVISNRCDVRQVR